MRFRRTFFRAFSFEVLQPRDYSSRAADSTGRELQAAVRSTNIAHLVGRREVNSSRFFNVSFSLRRIEEEELDKYSIPVKTESEKYKVIRTFSFLKSRMSSTRNKTKVEKKHLTVNEHYLLCYCHYYE